MKIHDLKTARQIKNVKIALDNIKDILKVLDLTIKALEHFKGYRAVQAILATIKYEKTILDAQMMQFKKLKEKE